MRSALRIIRQKTTGVRFNSSSSTNPSQNQQVQKAVESAQKVYDQTAATVKRVAGPVGQKISGALGGYRQPIVYNTKVFTSLLRQVYQAEKLAPPLELSQWANAYSSIISRGTRLSFWKETLRNGTWAGLGVAAIEAYGIFSIGEIIGRRNLVGYKLKEHEDESLHV